MIGNCPLCKREFGSAEYADEHHLIPKTFKGKETVFLHKICHQKIHHTFSERELAKFYHTIERLLSHEEIQKFVEWIKNKPPSFYVSHNDTKSRKSRR